MYVGFVYSTNVVEYSYNFNTSNYAFSRNYTVSNIVTAVYSTTGYNTLIVGTSSTIMIFNCSNGIFL